MVCKLLLTLNQSIFHRARSDEKLPKNRPNSTCKILVFNLKIVYLPWFSTNFNNFSFKCQVRLCFIQNETNVENQAKGFCSIVDQTLGVFFGTPCSSVCEKPIKFSYFNPSVPSKATVKTGRVQVHATQLTFMQAYIQMFTCQDDLCIILSVTPFFVIFRGLSGEGS